MILAVSNLSALFLGLLIYLGSNLIWNNSVWQIYSSNISAKFRREIARYWEKTDWQFELKNLVTGFLMIDTSEMLMQVDKEEDIEHIDVNNTKIEKIIKDNNGVISVHNPKHFYVYFGIPPIHKDFINQLVNSAYQLSTISFVLDKKDLKLPIALHAKKEWFKLVNNHGKVSYNNFGKSFNILPALIKIAKKFQIRVIITDNVYKLYEGKINVRMLDKVKIFGSDNIIRVFELLNEKQTEQYANLLDYFHAGLKLFEAGKWTEASSYFKQCLKNHPDDVPSAIYLQRCKDFEYISPLETWDGVFDVE
jgi:hypothetical protein